MIFSQYIQRIAFVLLWWLAALGSYAQELRSVLYQVEQGLPTNLTKAIYQDKFGFMWVGTDAGLVRFDGKNFISYTRQLPSNYIKGFFERRNGKLLVISDMGITEIENRVDTVLFDHIIQGSANLGTNVVCFPKEIYEDKYQHLWINESNSVVRYRNRKLKRYFFPERCMTTSFQRSFSFVEDGFGGFGLFSQQGFLFMYNAKTDKFEEVVLPQNIGKVSSAINVGRGQIWVGGNDGIFEVRIDEKQKIQKVQQLENLRDISCLKHDNYDNFYIGTWNTGFYKARMVKGQLLKTKVQSLTSNVINHIFLDANDEIWLSTDDGIAYLYASFFNKLAIPQQRSYVQAAIQSADGKIYTTEGALIFETKPSSGYENMNFEAEHKIIYREMGGDILSLEHVNNTLWFGTSYAKLYSREKDKFNSIDLTKYGRQIFFMKADRSGSLWVCQANAEGIVRITPDKKVVHYGKAQGLPINILCVRESKDGTLYFGGHSNEEGQYLFRYDAANDKFVNISARIPARLKNNFAINDLCFDAKKIWLGSNYGLLWQFPDSLVRVNIDQDGEVKAMNAASDGSIWLGTNAGIVKYQNGNFILFDESRGMPSKTISYRGIFLDKNDRVWAATANGLGYAQHINYITGLTPQPILLSLFVDNERIGMDSTAHYIFKHNANIRLNFVSLAYPANKTQYKYRLNTTWSAPTNQTEIMFPQMGKGEYELEIKALQHGSFEWSKPLVLHFSVQVPWYESWWFYLAQVSGILVIAGILWWQRQRVRFVMPITVLLFCGLVVLEEYFMIKAEPLIAGMGAGIVIFRIMINVLLALMLYIVDKGVRRIAKE
jgi:AraC family chitin signaling transcriptional activator